MVEVLFLTVGVNIFCMPPMRFRPPNQILKLDLHFRTPGLGVTPGGMCLETSQGSEAASIHVLLEWTAKLRQAASIYRSPLVSYSLVPFCGLPLCDVERALIAWSSPPYRENMKTTPVYLVLVSWKASSVSYEKFWLSVSCESCVCLFCWKVAFSWFAGKFCLSVLSGMILNIV